MECVTSSGESASPSGLAAWDWQGQPTVSDALLRAMLDHPAFAQAHRTAIEGALAYAEAEPVFQAMMMDLGSFFLCYLTLYMDATTGVTHRALRELCGGHGMISAGRATAVLWRLRGGGFVERDETGRFVPTRILRESMRKRFRVEYGALQAFEPNAWHFIDSLKDDAVFARLIRHMGEDLLGNHGGDRPDDKVLASLTHVGTRAAGFLIIYALVAATAPGDVYPPAGLTTASVAGLAKRFKVSRRHVLRVLKELEMLGFLACRDEQWVLLPRLGETLRLFQALLFVRYLRAAHRIMSGG